MEMGAGTATGKILGLAQRLRPEEIADYFNTELRQIVGTHIAMFQKLLFQDEELPPELAELFEDVGNRYLDISERITAHNLARRGSQVK